jgi:glycosyltransferase involved in cell wall biosynthesis
MNGPIPVLFIANYADRVGGGEESLLGLVRQLDRRRFVPIVLVPGEGELAAAVRACGVAVEVIVLGVIRPWTLPAVLRRAWTLRKAVRARRVRLVHAHGTRGALYAALALWRTGIPLVWHVRIVDRDPWVDRVLLRRSAALIANSQATAARFAPYAESSRKVNVIYNGVDLARYSRGSVPAAPSSFGIPDGHPVVTFAGRLEHGKGPDLFIEAAGVIHQKRPDSYFLVAGDGPLRAVLHARANEQRLPAVFVGRQADLRSVLAVSRVLVVPSRQEAFGRVLTEAMALEVPVVAARVGGIPEVCEDGRTALLVPAEDPGALADAVLRTLEDRAATAARVEAAAEEVRARFSLTDHAEQVGRLYERVLTDEGRA